MNVEKLVAEVDKSVEKTYSEILLFVDKEIDMVESKLVNQPMNEYFYHFLNESLKNINDAVHNKFKLVVNSKIKFASYTVKNEIIEFWYINISDVKEMVYKEIINDKKNK